jgi:aryl-alcohol dehydrogenase-like predicted oxidoreductase
MSPAAVAIPGTASVAHLEENVGALGVALSPADHERLERTAFTMPGRRGGTLHAARRRLTRLVRP